MTASPSTDNYFVGKGTVSFKPDGSTAYRDLGNVSEFEVTPTVEKLDHYSSRAGIKSKDKSVIVTKSATVRIVMDEVTMENLALGMGGTVVTASDGSKSFGMLEGSAVEGSLKLTGTNDVGVKLNWVGDVSFTPSGSFNPITEEWGKIEVTGEVLVDANGKFGIWSE